VSDGYVRRFGLNLLFSVSAPVEEVGAAGKALSRDLFRNGSDLDDFHRIIQRPDGIGGIVLRQIEDEWNVDAVLPDDQSVSAESVHRTGTLSDYEKAANPFEHGKTSLFLKKNANTLSLYSSWSVLSSFRLDFFRGLG